MTINWRRLLIDQLEFYWDAHLRPRLDGLIGGEICLLRDLYRDASRSRSWLAAGC